jgi:O-acetyl-ADP-ribose deacetylase
MNKVIKEAFFPGGGQVQLVQGDITAEDVDAIVNAANRHLAHGGGLAAEISRKGGPQIQAESDAWVRDYGPVSNADPAYTSAGRLPCKYIIHAVGPIWGEGDEDNKLASAVTGSLQVAENLNCQSVAIPAISTGIFGFPKDRAASLIMKAIKDYLREHPDIPLKQIRLTLLDQPTVDAFLCTWDAYF